MPFETCGTRTPLWLILFPLAFLIAIWQLASAAIPASNFFFSSPVRIIDALWQLVLTGRIFADAAVTVFEACAGFLIGTLSGTLLGLSLWYWPAAAPIGRPYIIAISAIPPFALAPLLIVWFGIGIFAKVMVAALATVFVSVVQTYEGARSADERHLRLVRILGGSRWQEFRKVIVPTALQWVATSMRLNVGFALTGAFIGEFISAERGLGYFIVRSASLFDMSRVLAGCIVMMIIALGLSSIVEFFASWILRRRGSV